MRTTVLLFTSVLFGTFLPGRSIAQCSLSNATTCVCRAGGTQCDLLPDITISWVGLQNYSSGPSEFPQTGTNAGRLRISGSTPNIGYGPLEVRTADVNGLRRFVCGTDTFTVTGQTNFFCPNGQEPKQVLHQRVYRKQGNQMTWREVMTGNMTYHYNHNHYHVDDWTTMTLRIAQPGVNDPRQWPVVATGAKVGFCLMDYGPCSSYSGHCRTSQEYQGGTALNSSSNFPNYGLFGSYGCGTNVQGISVGRTDIYSKSLDMMWINMMDGLCNGDYWIVAEVDPTNVFLEENDENNWTAIPFSLTQQRPTGSGGSAGILAEQGTRLVPGGTVRLTATPGYSYAWSNGATTRSIEVSEPGAYSVNVTAPCGSLASGTVTVTAAPVPSAPEGTGAAVFQGEPATLSATGDGLLWYDAPSGGQQVGSGNTFQTPALQEDRSYWVSSRVTVPGVNVSGGKTDRTAGALNASDIKHFLLFDAAEPFELVSVKVYATGNGDRHFVLVDNVGNLLDERYVYVRDGEQRVNLNFKVPAGTGHRISAFNDNTEIVRNLHRDNAGVAYPYPIGTVGSITGSTSGPGQYYYLYDWEVRTPDVVVESARTQVTATVNTGVRLAPKAILEGAWHTASGLMRDDLRMAGLIPMVEPFTARGFQHVGGGGNESMASSLLAITGPEAIVDWVLVELRDANAPGQVVATASALLRRNGTIVSATGEPLRFAVLDGNYHVAIRHRNHLGALSGQALALSAAITEWDLSDPSTLTWGSAACKPLGTVQGLWAGNVLHDDRLKYTGSANDRDPMLALIGGTVPTQTVQGYLDEDVNLDGVVRYTGTANDRDMILVNIGGVVPTEVRFQQLP